MLRVIGCLSQYHDPMIVVGAVVICLLASLAACLLMERMREAGRRGQRRMQWCWQIQVGLVLGGGAWTTHFVAMLAYDPGLPTGFDLGTTLASAVVAVLAAILGAGLCTGQDTGRHLAGGALAGAGIGAMHYLGMAGLRIQAVLHFDGPLVLASLLAIVLLGAPAFRLAARGGWRRGVGAALVLTAGIGTVHFTGMAAIEALPDPTLPLPDAVGDHHALTLVLGLGVGFVLLVGLATLLLDARGTARRQAEEAARLRSLAEATFEGVAICDGPVIAEMNHQLAGLLGRPRQEVVGMPLASFLAPDRAGEVAALLLEAESRPITVELAGAEDVAVPVELRVRPLEALSGERKVVAVRDLRASLASEARIRHLALHDSLTELGNRVMLRERLAAELALARTTGRGLAVHCLDLDRFKAVNDLHGHAAGDDLLRQAAARICAELREADVAARLGGDEFVVVQSAADAQGAARLATRLTRALSRPFRILEGQQVSISGSVGVALFPADGDQPETLLARADMALYEVKEGGRNGFAFYHPALETETRNRRQLEQDLKRAEAEGQLFLQYQPQADVRSCGISGFEALLRWRHPERGLVPPDLFIPLAEASGMIVPIGAWVLREACAEAARWKVPLSIAVNVSPVQIQHGDLVELVTATLAETGLDPTRLELEVTEGVLLRDGARALTVLTRLRELGVRIALDDFGTGYSSLSTLRAFPFDKIKVDRSFVRDLASSTESAAIVRAVLGLGHGLGLPVIAEGVETEEQRRALAESGCADIQGYLIGRPAPIGAFAAVTGLRADAGSVVH
ncbi:putative bifunctional diguanylate cyclase/phosphodiesterase [Paracraurococcus lichenis]|uniref:EAL domain-containing protein n=1 Tax=Paracraurococcus lichenis TaxID=3064888 RepID=A0ABT9EAY8_9PROT|nr:EAL domain-containing protein [Paracraurococcus sp. LOR1-02]MDO9713138.1 EAL domain-containing protein [Paracraurococcus sp. LOR1-02]